MTVESHIDSLKMRHEELDGELQKKLKSTSINEEEIADLKRKKLQLKDRIQSLASAN